ncbi:protein suppressor of hairy wing isoform X4 [Patella vulgata]|uniref:protein suppressor of hairy wing isoform X4 n=1 Tax=Patella vulgata TaxID=6465 RepID=UPI0021809A5D|nr:protein suppressor of hairy wing isoform X4 [Patella vulgata]
MYFIKSTIDTLRVKRASHQCTVCNKVFQNYSQFVAHNKIHVKQEKLDNYFQCKLCDEKYEIYADLEKHCKTHVNEEKSVYYQCRHCEKRFRQNTDLEEHCKLHVKPEESLVKASILYQCSLCKKNFTQYCDLDKHVSQCNQAHSNNKHVSIINQPNSNDKSQSTISVNNGEQTLKSSTSTSINGSLKKNGVNSSREKLYKCSICEKSFWKSDNLIKHTTSHIREKLFKCGVCDKTFRESRNLIKHTRIHVKDKPYKCDVCSKSFRESRNLIEHTRIHVKDKPYKCDVCSKSFCDNDNLLKHIQSHMKQRLKKCDVCSKSFLDTDKLLKHTRSHTREKVYECDVCSQSFSTNAGLQKHIKIHKENLKKSTFNRLRHLLAKFTSDVNKIITTDDDDDDNELLLATQVNQKPILPSSQIRVFNVDDDSLPVPISSHTKMIIDDDDDDDLISPSQAIKEIKQVSSSSQTRDDDDDKDDDGSLPLSQTKITDVKLIPPSSQRRIFNEDDDDDDGSQDIITDIKSIPPSPQTMTFDDDGSLTLSQSTNLISTLTRHNMILRDKQMSSSLKSEILDDDDDDDDDYDDDDSVISEEMFDDSRDSDSDSDSSDVVPIMNNDVFKTVNNNPNDKIYFKDVPLAYFRGIQKTKVGKSGQIKKSDRVFSNRHSCLYCGILVCKPIDHIERMHSDEKEVADLNLKPKKTDSSRERHEKSSVRRKQLEILRNRGNHKHNLAVKLSEVGEIIPLRRPSGKGIFYLSKFGPCPNCYGWISDQSKHRYRCVVKDKDIKGKSCGTAKSNSHKRKSEGTSTAKLTKEVLETMAAEDRTKVSCEAKDKEIERKRSARKDSNSHKRMYEGTSTTTFTKEVLKTTAVKDCTTSETLVLDDDEGLEKRKSKFTSSSRTDETKKEIIEDVWNKEKREAYNEVFLKLVHLSGKMLKKEEIMSLKNRNPVLKKMTYDKIRNKMNADVQKIRRNKNKT